VSELSGFCVFLEDESTDLRENFFSGFRRKHLIITTNVEKQCTPALNIAFDRYTSIGTVMHCILVISVPYMSKPLVGAPFLALLLPSLISGPDLEAWSDCEVCH